MQLINILLFRSYNCCDLQFWYITVSFFRILKHYVVIKFGRIITSCLLH